MAIAGYTSFSDLLVHKPLLKKWISEGKKVELALAYFFLSTDKKGFHHLLLQPLVVFSELTLGTQEEVLTRLTTLFEEHNARGDFQFKVSLTFTTNAALLKELFYSNIPVVK